MKKRKKRAVTLIEIMIVILLIGLIGGALAFNMRGSMDQGKIFKTEQNITRVYDILMMEYANGERKLDQIAEDKVKVLEESPLVKDGVKLLKDGWGQDLIIQYDPIKDDLKISSKKLNEIKSAKAKK